MFCGEGDWGLVAMTGGLRGMGNGGKMGRGGEIGVEEGGYGDSGAGL